MKRIFNRGTKITTLFWVAIFGLILTTIYSYVLLNQGLKTKKMIKYIYKFTQKEEEEEETS